MLILKTFPTHYLAKQLGFQPFSQSFKRTEEEAGAAFEWLDSMNHGLVFVPSLSNCENMFLFAEIIISSTSLLGGKDSEGV